MTCNEKLDEVSLDEIQRKTIESLMIHAFVSGRAAAVATQLVTGNLDINPGPKEIKRLFQIMLTQLEYIEP